MNSMNRLSSCQRLRLKWNCCFFSSCIRFLPQMQKKFPKKSCWQVPLQHFNVSGAAGEMEHVCPVKAQHGKLGSWHVPLASLIPMNFLSPQHVSWPQHWESEEHPETFSSKQSQHFRFAQNSVPSQSESLQHSRHLLNSGTPQQWPDSQSESGPHELPFGLGAMHFLSLLMMN